MNWAMSRLAIPLLAGIFAVGCGEGEKPRIAKATPASGTAAILFSPEGNRLNAYQTTSPFRRQTVIQRRSDDPSGWDVNGQVCFARDGSGLFVAGEDTGQPTIPPGWGVFQVEGRTVGELSARRVARLVPTYQPTDRNPDNFGCVFLPDGRVLTTVIGSLGEGPADGQLLIWFPPFDPEGPTASCKLDVAIGMAGQLRLDEEGAIYVASARSRPGVWRYTGDLPTAADAAGGCGRRDAAGSPMVDAGRLTAEHLIDAPAEHLTGAMGLAIGPDGTFFVSRSIAGTIAAFSATGDFLRWIVRPPEGARLGAVPLPHGTPSGLAVTSDGVLFYADLGLVADPVPRAKLGLGSVRRIDLRVSGAPEPIDSGLDYPDVVSLWQPGH